MSHHISPGLNMLLYSTHKSEVMGKDTPKTSPPSQERKEKTRVSEREISSRLTVCVENCRFAVHQDRYCKDNASQ